MNLITRFRVSRKGNQMQKTVLKNRVIQADRSNGPEYPMADPYEIASGVSGRIVWTLNRQFDARFRTWHFVTISTVNGFDDSDQAEVLQSWIDWFRHEGIAVEVDWNEIHGTDYVDLIGDDSPILRVLAEILDRRNQ